MSDQGGLCPTCKEPFDDHKLPTPVAAMMGLSITKPVCRPIKDRK